MGPSMLLGEDAQEEKREAPASRRARGKERAVQASPPPEMDEEMARCLQEWEEEEEQCKEGAGHGACRASIAPPRRQMKRWCGGLQDVGGGRGAGKEGAGRCHFGRW